MSIVVEEDIIINSGYIQTDQIIENTSNNGVLIENVLLKDSTIRIGSGTSSYTFPSEIGSSGQILVANTSGGLTFETSGSSPNIVLAPSPFGIDNRLVKSLGTGRDLEVTGITISDTNDISGINQLTLGSGSSSYYFPTEVGLENQVLSVNSDGGLIFTSTSGNANAVIAPDTFGTDNRMLRTSGTNRDIESTGITISDTDDISGINNATITGTLTASGATALGSTLTVTGNSTMTGTLKISSTLDSSSSTSNGALVVSGGAVIGKNLYIGGDFFVEGTTTTINSTTTTIIDPMFKVANGNPADTYDFGFYGEYRVGNDGTFAGTLRYSGFHRVGADSIVTAPEIAGKWILFDSATTEPGPLNVGDPGIPGDLVLGELTASSIVNSGSLTINDVTDSTTTSNGALIVAGGVGIAKNLNVGGITTINDTTEATDSSTGALIVSGGIGIGGTTNTEKLIVNENTTLTGTLTVSGTASLSTTSITNLSLGIGTNSYSFPVNEGNENQVLSVNNAGDLIFSKVPINSSETSSTVTTSTTSTTYVVVNSMTTTPIAGDYIVLFSSSGNGNTQNQQMEYVIFVDGVEITRSHKFQNYAISNAMNNMRNVFYTQARVTVNGAQTIDVRYRTDTGSFTMYERNLILIEV